MDETIASIMGELKSFRLSTNIPILLTDRDGSVIFRDGEPSECSMCSLIGCSETECRKTRIKCGEDSIRFGGRYIFLCPMGFAHAASPVLLEGTSIVTAIAGPMLLIDKDDYCEEYIDGKKELSDENKTKLKEIVCQIDPTDLNKATAVSDLLYCLSSYLSGREAVKLISAGESSEQQSGIGSSIIELKRVSASRDEYPIFKERELLDVISGGDRKTAQKLLNEILGYIFFSTGGNADVVRARVSELIVQLSRTALINNGGTDSRHILDLSAEYLKTIWQLDTVDDISLWMSRIMSSFTQIIFSSKDIKHIDVIQKVVAFINLNYMHKLSLDDIADEVYLSSSYLSKIFKSEMKINLSTYLNNVRVEKSKIFLLDSSVNIVDVASRVGFEEQSYFSKVFKNVTGVSPGKYRQLKGHIK